jgi:hypothetical protein
MALKVLWAEEVVLFVLVAKNLHLLVVQLEPGRLFVGAVLLVIDLAAFHHGLYLHWRKIYLDLLAPGCGWS